MTADGEDVGPVLLPGDVATAIVAAIRRAHPDARVLDRGGYLRVLVRGRCTLSRRAVEEEVGGPFRLPEDLEPVMPSFKGRFFVSDHEARWEFARRDVHGAA